MGMASLICRREALKAKLAKAEALLARRKASITAELTDIASRLLMRSDAIDTYKVDLAETIVSVSSYANGGDARASVIADAIKQFATGQALRPRYGDLWFVFFGTKSYDHWHGQRCDCEYGYGPSHGSIIFSVRVTDSARKRKQSDLTPDEVEAVLYYLQNIERIQNARRAVAA